MLANAALLSFPLSGRSRHLDTYQGLVALEASIPKAVSTPRVDAGTMTSRTLPKVESPPDSCNGG